MLEIFGSVPVAAVVLAALGLMGIAGYFIDFCFNLFHRFLLLPQISCLASGWWVHSLRARRERRLKAHLIFCTVHIPKLGWF